MNINVYESILDNIHDGVYFVDRNKKITFWNKGAERISGFTADEVIGSHCDKNLLNHVDDNGKRLCLDGCPLHETIQDGMDREINIYLHNKAGYRVPVKIKTIPFQEKTR